MNKYEQDRKMRDYFLSDPTTKESIELSIIRKADELAVLQREKALILANTNLHNEIIDEAVRKYFIQKVAELKCGKQIKTIEKEIRNISFALRENETEYDQPSDWQLQYEHATERVRMVDVARYFLKVSNFKRNVKCPFHQEKSASFKVYEKDNRFICFGCGVRGSPIDFVMKIKHLSFKEAVVFLSNF